jgi:predicted Zn-dependent protease
VLLIVLLTSPGCLTLLGGEQRVGDQAAAEVERETGIVDSLELEAYVRAIGERLARESKRDGPWRFVILDEPAPNAFALPGGHVYVTRGLLALVNSEDELAGVVGHEIGHVLAGHGGKRVTLNAPFAIITGITSFATGLVIPRLGQAVSDAGNALSQGLVVAPYSRQQEHEADRIGQELAAAAGWDPLGISGFLDTLGRATILILGEEQRASWLDTHPATPDRVSQTAERARELESAPRAPIARDRADLLGRLDGLLVGLDAAHGVRVGSRFVRPEGWVSAEFPEGWLVDGNAVISAAQAPSGDALIAIQLAGEGDDPRAAVRAMEEEIGEAIEVEEISVGGKRALRASGTERGRGGRIYFESTWLAAGDGVVRVITLCEERRADAWGPTFEAFIRSLRSASQEERAAVRDRRLRSAAARSNESAAELAARTGSDWSGDKLEVANAVAAGHRFEAGAWVKITLEEPYRPRRRP